ncbi:MAG: BMC domain-containing protein [Candidatus Hydrogenedentes bacterium]|nr:BMC domain-containing protein [Candidatus Hydrogenedentota bacterium]
MSVLGMVEFASIAVGIRASDAMVKAAPVDLIESRPITPGKYMSLVTGEVAAVQASVHAGVTAAGADAVVESFVLANLHEQVLPAILGKAPAPELDAVGVLETRSAAKIVEAADAACKAAPVRLITLHLANHIGGKGYTTFAGHVADVEAAVDAGAIIAGADLVDRVVIPNPYPEIYEYLTKKHAW